MKSVFEPPTREELIKRINTIGEQNKSAWGKMNVFSNAEALHIIGRHDVRKDHNKKSSDRSFDQ